MTLNILASANDFSAIVDMVALIFILCFALFGFMNGFTKTFFSTFGTIIAIFLAVLLSSSVSSFLQEKFSFVSVVSDSISGVLNGIFGEEFMSMNLANASEEVLRNSGLAGFVLNVVLQVKADGSLPMDTTLTDIICPTFAYYIVLIISVIALFILFKLIFYLVSEIIKNSYKNGLIKKFDKTFGLALGFINGIVNLEILIMVISIVPIAFFQDLYISIQMSSIASIVEKINLFGVILNALSSQTVIDAIKLIIQ